MFKTKYFIKLIACFKICHLKLTLSLLKSMFTFHKRWGNHPWGTYKSLNGQNTIAIIIWLIRALGNDRAASSSAFPWAMESEHTRARSPFLVCTHTQAAAVVNNHQPRVAKVKVSNATPRPVSPKWHSVAEKELCRLKYIYIY